MMVSNISNKPTEIKQNKKKERTKTMKRVPEWILDEMESKNKQADEYDYVSYEEARAKSM